MKTIAEKRKRFNVVNMNDSALSFDRDEDMDAAAQEQLNQQKESFLHDRKMAYIRSVCLEFDLSDIITVLGESDVLEVIGIQRCLEFVQAVGLGPAGEDKRFCRERVAELAYCFTCDD